MIVLIVLVHLLDFLTLIVAASIWGFGGEYNPWAYAMYTLAGFAGVASFKAAGVALAVTAMSYIRAPTMRRVAGSLLVGVGVVGMGANCLAVWVAMR